MASLDDIFYKEFNQMLYACRAYKQQVSLYDIPIPNSSEFSVSGYAMLFVHGIEDSIFSGLNDKVVLRWTEGALRRRKFDYKSEFIKKDGHYVTEEVTTPQSCTGVLSDIKLGVPTKYSSKEGFSYVDTLKGRYCYILPKKYCFPVNQTALVVSFHKLRVYYEGVGLAMTNGQLLYMYVIPYRPSKVEKNYRVLCTKDGTDFNKEVSLLQRYWLSGGMIYNPEMCRLEMEVKGRTNMSYEIYQGNIDVYEHHDLNRSLEGLVEGEEDLNNEFDQSDESI